MIGTKKAGDQAFLTKEVVTCPRYYSSFNPDGLLQFMLTNIFMLPEDQRDTIKWKGP